jgi:predicted XRE-type DNA-binding protein
MKGAMERRSFDNVWDALEATLAEAARMTMRADLLIAIDQRVRSWGVTQAEAACRLGVTQPRLNDLLRGKIDKFSLDTLVMLATRAGLSVRIDMSEPLERA